MTLSKGSTGPTTTETTSAGTTTSGSRAEVSQAPRMESEASKDLEAKLKEMMKLTSQLTFFMKLNALDSTKKRHEQFCKSLQVFLVQPNQIIFDQGEESTEFFVVLQGKVQVFFIDDKSKTYFEACKDIVAGGYFGELGLMNNSRRSTTVKNGNEISYISVIGKQDFFAIFDEILLELFAADFIDSVMNHLPFLAAMSSEITPRNPQRSHPAFNIMQNSFVLDSILQGDTFDLPQISPAAFAEGVFFVLEGSFQAKDVKNSQATSTKSIDVCYNQAEILSDLKVAQMYPNSPKQFYSAQCSSQCARLLYITNNPHTRMHIFNSAFSNFYFDLPFQMQQQYFKGLDDHLRTGNSGSNFRIHLFKCTPATAAGAASHQSNAINAILRQKQQSAHSVLLQKQFKKIPESLYSNHMHFYRMPAEHDRIKEEVTAENISFSFNSESNSKKNKETNNKSKQSHPETQNVLQAKKESDTEQENNQNNNNNNKMNESSNSSQQEKQLTNENVCSRESLTIEMSTDNTKPTLQKQQSSSSSSHTTELQQQQLSSSIQDSVDLIDSIASIVQTTSPVLAPLDASINPISNEQESKSEENIIFSEESNKELKKEHEQTGITSQQNLESELNRKSNGNKSAEENSQKLIANSSVSVKTLVDTSTQIEKKKPTQFDPQFFARKGSFLKFELISASASSSLSESPRPQKQFQSLQQQSNQNQTKQQQPANQIRISSAGQRADNNIFTVASLTNFKNLHTSATRKLSAQPSSQKQRKNYYSHQTGEEGVSTVSPKTIKSNSTDFSSKPFATNEKQSPNSNSNSQNTFQITPQFEQTNSEFLKLIVQKKMSQEIPRTRANVRRLSNNPKGSDLAQTLQKYSNNKKDSDSELNNLPEEKSVLLSSTTTLQANIATTATAAGTTTASQQGITVSQQIARMTSSGSGNSILPNIKKEYNIKQIENILVMQKYQTIQQITRQDPLKKSHGIYRHRSVNNLSDSSLLHKSKEEPKNSTIAAEETSSPLRKSLTELKKDKSRSLVSFSASKTNLARAAAAAVTLNPTISTTATINHPVNTIYASQSNSMNSTGSISAAVPSSGIPTQTPQQQQQQQQQLTRKSRVVSDYTSDSKSKPSGSQSNLHSQFPKVYDSMLACLLINQKGSDIIVESGVKPKQSQSSLTQVSSSNNYIHQRAGIKEQLRMRTLYPFSGQGPTFSATSTSPYKKIK